MSGDDPKEPLETTTPPITIHTNDDDGEHQG